VQSGQGLTFAAVVTRDFVPPKMDVSIDRSMIRHQHGTEWLEDLK
jgi:hypothetical protein